MVHPENPPAKRPRDSTATKELLLKAAREEFSEYGLAGARIDRIGERAGVNKRLLYVYFGEKDQLFDTILEQWSETVLREMPLVDGDLCAFAAVRFDYFVAKPDDLRLANWRILERVKPTEAERKGYRTRVASVAAAQKRGGIRSDIPALDLFALVLRMTESWLGAPPGLKAVAGRAAMSASRLREHRASLLEAVRSVTVPG